MSQKIIYIHAGWENDAPIGVLYTDTVNEAEVISFKYFEKWLRDHPSLFLDPMIANISYRNYPTDKLLFGAFEDTCPDRWGRQLIDRRESYRAHTKNQRPVKYTETGYMLEIQDQYRAGGFRFKTDPHGEFIGNDILPAPPVSSIRELEQISLGYEKGTTDHWISQLVAPGSSLGEARPKANVADKNGNLWIAKFPSKHDQYDVGAWEKTVHDLAKQCQIQVPESQLMKYNDIGSTFLVKRFDRGRDLLGQITRIHFASAMTMLGLRDGKTTGTGFLDLAEIVSQITHNPDHQLEQLFRRMIFDIAISNEDDHLRNHGFLLQGDRWILSPAYDINPVHNAEYLSMNIDLDDGYRSFEKALSTAAFYHLSEEKASCIVEQIATIVANSWDKLAGRYGLSEHERRNMSPAFELASEYSANITHKKVIPNPSTNIMSQMEKRWEQYFALPKNERKGITWNGKRIRIAVFEDIYIAKCQEAKIEPKKTIAEHFWQNCVAMQEYVPQYCDAQTKNR